jgi:hypothetical protein
MLLRNEESRHFGRLERDRGKTATRHFGTSLATIAISHKETAPQMQSQKPRGIFSLVAAALTGAYDPHRTSRVAKYVAQAERIIAVKKRDFSFSDAVVELQISDHDRPYVAEQLYEHFLIRAWKDDTLTDQETELLKWAAGNLGLRPAKIKELQALAAINVFQKILAKAMADGVVDTAESDHLNRIATRCGETVASMMAGVMAREGEAFVRNIFSSHAAGGRLSAGHWNDLTKTVERLGISRPAMLQAIRNPARKLIEHTLTDARSDGLITQAEEATIDFLLTNTLDDADFSRYVRAAIADTKEASNIARGILPSISAPQSVALRAGEIVHWEGSVQYHRVRELANGPKTIQVDGHGVVTDSRLIFSAPDSSFQISHSKVLGHHRNSDALEIRTAGKWAGTYYFSDPKHRAAEIWRVAIGRANQTIVASDPSQSSRHISRDVRQRVWQRYGGQCAECQSDSYLEFDHIVPVAKGGSNSDANVQLLCRKCNLAKSDRI